MNKEKYNQIIEAVGQEYTKWFYDNAVPSVSGKPILNGEGILTRGEFINKCKTDPEFSEKWGLKIEERELSSEERLPKKIKLIGHGGEMEFSLTDKRQLIYYGKSKESNESIWRTEQIKDDEVFYVTEFGWGVFLNTNAFETVSYDGTEWGGQKLNTPTKLITLTYNNKTIESYE